ncbi:MAG: class I SAM-dependent methyltransferase [Treponema sp.]|nr:class I SAM-dependent methyltransferase [Treponema sp.]
MAKEKGKVQTPMTIEQYYNKFHEENRLGTRHGRVEFNTTCKYIQSALDEILQKGQSKPDLQKGQSKIKLCDLGAGTGRYSVEFCHRGYDVTAVELVKHNLEILRSKHENIKTWQGDARNLSFLDDETFDVTLLFGPMYHLHGDEEKLKALNEAKRITKNGGIILVAYVMNEYSVIQYCFKEHHWAEAVEKGGLSPDFHTQSAETELYDYVRLDDINRLNEKAGLARIKIISADGPSDYMRRELNEMSEEEFEAFLNFQLANCERPELVGAGSHTVDILRK